MRDGGGGRSADRRWSEVESQTCCSVYSRTRSRGTTRREAPRASQSGFDRVAGGASTRRRRARHRMCGKAVHVPVTLSVQTLSKDVNLRHTSTLDHTVRSHTGTRGRFKPSGFSIGSCRMPPHAPHGPMESMEPWCMEPKQRRSEARAGNKSPPHTLPRTAGFATYRT